MEVALLSYQSMVVAPLLYPACETPEAPQVEAHGLIKMVFNVGHKVHQALFFEAQGFRLILEEVFKELVLEPRPLHLLKGGNIEFVVDLEDMLQVLPPTTAAKVCCQSHGIAEGGPRLTSPLRLGSFRCRWWWNTGHRPGGQITLLMLPWHTRLPLHASWVTDRSAAASPPSRVRSSMVL